MFDEASESCSILLERHQIRRLQAVPTISVLAGPVALGVRAFRSWNARRAAFVTQVDDATIEQTIMLWARTLAEQNNLLASAIAWLVQRTTSVESDLRLRLPFMTLQDLDRFWEAQKLETNRDSIAALCRCLLSMRVVDPNREIEHAMDRLRADASTDEIHFLVQLASLLGPQRLGAILVATAHPHAGAGWVKENIQFLESLVSAVPALPCAIATTAENIQGALDHSPEGRWQALMREGLIEVTSMEASRLRERVLKIGIDAAPLSGTLERLATIGISQELADHFADAAQSLSRPASPAENDKARSASERFLFELLESLPETAGLFALNQRLEFRHGNAAAEADLVAPKLKVVIELDGSYYHLSNLDAYRRDRRKDWLLQQHGYLVLRFLADDVVRHLEEILNTILAALQLRR